MLGRPLLFRLSDSVERPTKMRKKTLDRLPRDILADPAQAHRALEGADDERCRPPVESMLGLRTLFHFIKRHQLPDWFKTKSGYYFEKITLEVQEKGEQRAKNILK